METVDPREMRQFAVEVVERLRHAGYEGLWAGGCVRDQLLGRSPKDYDVATNATPHQVRDLFGHRRTLPIGAAFGVVTILGRGAAGSIEVATFRRDASYSDGRHPDAVTFSSAEDDAQRRDFTINGMFFDPLAEQVIDYVGGQDDLRERRVRAIRDPRERFAEDKLRMLRAVRFAATFDFSIETKTIEAIQELAGQIVIVSAERIAAEMRRMLVHENRRRAVELLRAVGLLPVILPEAAVFEQEAAEPPNDATPSRWAVTLRLLDALHQPGFAAALAALIRQLADVPPADFSLASSSAAALEAAFETPPPDRLARTVCSRWKLSNEETETVLRLREHESAIRRARQLPWPRLQRLLVCDRIADLLCYGEATARVVDGDVDAIAYCREKLALPRDELDPPPLVTGDDLRASGLRPGPEFKSWLTQLRDAQLEKQITTKSEAMEVVRQFSQQVGGQAAARAAILAAKPSAEKTAENATWNVTENKKNDEAGDASEDVARPSN